MELPQRHGEPCPRPGTSALRITFSVGLQCTGGVCPSVAMLSQCGPRHQGQSSAAGLTAGRSSVAGGATGGADASHPATPIAMISNKSRRELITPVCQERGSIDSGAFGGVSGAMVSIALWENALMGRTCSSWVRTLPYVVSSDQCACRSTAYHAATARKSCCIPFRSRAKPADVHRQTG